METLKEQLFWCNPDNHLIHAFVPGFARKQTRLVRELLGLAASIFAVAALPMLVVLIGALTRDGGSVSSIQFWRVLGVGLLIAVLGRLTIIACSSSALQPRWLLPTLLVSVVPPLLAAIYFYVGTASPIVTGLAVDNLSFLVVPMMVVLVPAWLVWSWVFLAFFRRITAAHAG